MRYAARMRALRVALADRHNFGRSSHACAPLPRPCEASLTRRPPLRAAPAPRRAAAGACALGSHTRVQRRVRVMDVLFGLVGDGFVLLVSDTSRVQSIVVQRTSLDKIVQLDSHKLMVRPRRRSRCLCGAAAGAARRGRVGPGC